MTPTLSGLHLCASCPGSASLPRYAREGDRAPTLGRAIHALIEDTIDGSRYRGDPYDPAKLAEMFHLDPDDAGRLAFLAEHLRLPVPVGALAEVSLGYFRDGSVRRIEGGAGRYPDVGQWLSGQIDLMWAEPHPLHFAGVRAFPDRRAGEPAYDCPPGSTLWLCDVKTGSEEWVPPIARNWQLRGGAVLAARWTGATRVIPAICYINAAECAAAVRAGATYEGRWEVGAPLDAAALDAIEVEMRAVLARARGEGDDGVQLRRIGGPGLVAPAGVPDAGGLGGAAPSPTGSAQRDCPPRLILGPHCDHCPARAGCPAFAAEAVNLWSAWKEAGDESGKRGLQDRTARDGGGAHGQRDGGGPGSVPESAGPPAVSGRDALAQHERDGYPSDGPRGAYGAIVLTHAARSHLAGILPALRSACDRIEAAVRAGGPVLLADGREYGPVVEPVTSYRTQPTWEALAAVVGEERANDAAEYTSAALKRALTDAGAPRGAWGRLRATLEAWVPDGWHPPMVAPGAVVVAGRERWTRRWPAMPVKGGDDEPRDGRERLGGDAVDARRGAEPEPLGSVGAAPCEREGAAGVDGGDTAGIAPGLTAAPARAPCSVCGGAYAVTRSGRVRKHQRPGGGLYCPGSGMAPQPTLIPT